MNQNYIDNKLKEILMKTDSHTIVWIDEKIKEHKKLMMYYKCAMMEIETKFKVLNEEYSLEHDRNPINSIKTRLKSLESIKEKMEHLEIPVTPDNIEKYLNDIAGVRVICSFVDDVYALSEALLRQDDITLIEKKDYIKHPKDNGYRSLHMIVAIPIYLSNEKQLIKVEIQLRTIAMDFWASLEHQLKYKKEFEFTEEMLQELTNCAEISSTLDQSMNDLRRKTLERKNT